MKYLKQMGRVMTTEIKSLPGTMELLSRKNGVQPQVPGCGFTLLCAILGCQKHFGSQRNGPNQI